MSAMPGMPPMGPGNLGPPHDPGAGLATPGGLQFQSADPQAIMGLLSQLIASDQQALGEAQVQAVGGAFSQLLASQPDPTAQAAASGPSPIVGPDQRTASSGY